MKNWGLKFDHLGIAVSKPENAKRFLEGLGYRIGNPIFDSLQKVNLSWCESEKMPSVELIYSAGVSGPIDNILKNRKEMIYHICYRSKDVLRSIDLMRKGGNRVMCISPSKPAILFANNPVSFYFIDGFGLIEIIEAK